MTKPDMAQTLEVGATFPIAWVSTKATTHRVQFVAVNPNTGAEEILPIVTDLGPVQSYSWSIPRDFIPVGTQKSGRIRVVARNATTLQNVSAGRAVTLTLHGQAPALSVQVMYPNGGEALTLNQPVTIRSITSGNAVSHGIRLSKDGGTTFPIEIASGLGVSDQSYTWSPTADMITGQGRLQIEARDSAGTVKTAQSASDLHHR